MQLVQLLTTTEANACPKSATRAALAEEQHNGINLFIAHYGIEFTSQPSILCLCSWLGFRSADNPLALESIPAHSCTDAVSYWQLWAVLMATAGLAPSCCPVSHRILRTCSEDPAVTRPVIVCPRLGINERDARMSDSNYSSVRLCQ